MTRLKQPRRKNHISDRQLAEVIALGEPIGRMMGGFIKYLAATGFTDRGRHAVAPKPPRPTAPPFVRGIHDQPENREISDDPNPDPGSRD